MVSDHQVTRPSSCPHHGTACLQRHVDLNRTATTSTKQGHSKWGEVNVILMSDFNMYIVYIHTYIHTYIRTYVRTVRTYVRTYRQTDRQTYIQTDIHTFIHTYIHVDSIDVSCRFDRCATVHVKQMIRRSDMHRYILSQLSFS